MWTKFTDAEDKKLVVLALEYESQRKRVQWKEVARAMRGKYSAQALQSRLRALKRTYGMDISRFPRFFFSTHRVKRNELSVMFSVLYRRSRFDNKLEGQMRTQVRCFLLRFQK
ncbi:uncharacterized protein PITG_20661 [Phytophthora infestans T30-4]|uniref:Myb-like domain-containing protein n=1 Tax=Phytophthora infestans (strain T30-4) TaxID=403677 RepID=D0P2H9_PHYIT|nr:uncharacterized protein PITG_20661 [Phytophthora infestans T30-4]EEY56273.1 conserved hypothetical protein [Phytophthora infestans T30-4]|eukprot:XP_002895496.1 conserved hypothetical protein [Phytophthora infestans T30-4]